MTTIGETTIGDFFDSTKKQAELAEINEKAFICIDGVNEVLRVIEESDDLGELRKEPDVWDENNWTVVSPEFTTVDPKYSGHEFSVGKVFTEKKKIWRPFSKPVIQPVAVVASHRQWCDEESSWGGSMDIPIGGFVEETEVSEYFADHLDEAVEGFYTQLGFVAAGVGVELQKIK